MATRYVIYGAGAIGSAVGAHLWRTSHSVLLVGRAAHVNRIREAGLSLVTPDETFVLHVPATIDLRDTGVQPGDVILLCVKSQDTETALREVPTLVPTRSPCPSSASRTESRTRIGLCACSRMSMA
jgi:2-dehydropantoate 2-reductase